MEIRDLRVLHWRAAQPAAVAEYGRSGDRDLFWIDTCQRRVAVMCGREAMERARAEFPADGALECFEGTDAYAFMVRFACGLESKLVAETEIFGQIKESWRTFAEQHSPQAEQLSSWIQLLFQDAKSLRSQYLSKLGSNSYGSQVRRLLGEEAASGPTLLIGAGQLAQAVAPWLLGSELWLYNRTPDRAAELARELAKREPNWPVRVIDASLQAELAAWRTARNIVVCVPGAPELDAARSQAWRERRISGGAVIHLGLSGEGDTVWRDLPGVVSLGELFEMLKTQSDLRRRQIERARRACREKALLRSLGASSSHPHSWEDLAAFDTL